MKEDMKLVWDTIADSWSRLRTRPWEELVTFSKKVEGKIVLDIGCGNGRNLIPFEGKERIGIDFSKGMIREARKFLGKRGKKVSLVVGDFTALPLKSEAADIIISNAVLHDIYPKIQRKKAIEELKRIAKKRSTILISVWGRWQKRFVFPLIKSLFTGRYPDVWVGWNYKGKVYQRFYHLYTKKELENELKNLSLNPKKCWKDNKGNIWVLIKK